MSNPNTPKYCATTCATTCHRLGVCAALADCRDTPWHPVIDHTTAHPESIQVEDDWAEGAGALVRAAALVLAVGAICALVSVYVFVHALGWLGVQI
jgi:hypothetical protein